MHMCAAEQWTKSVPSLISVNSSIITLSKNQFSNHSRITPLSNTQDKCVRTVMRSCRHWVPQVSEFGEGASALLLYHGEGSGSCPCLAPFRASPGVWGRFSALPCSRSWSACSGSWIYHCRVGLQLPCGWGGAITPQGQQAGVWHFWECPGETERCFCVVPFSLEHSCVNCTCWFCSVSEVFVFIFARIPENTGFVFKVLLSFFEAEK